LNTNNVSNGAYKKIKKRKKIMANCCWYEMVAVAPKKETLERLIKIMNYEDDEYFIYRCRSCSSDEIVFDEKSNLYYVGIQGDVAWSCEKWFETVENKNELMVMELPII